MHETKKEEIKITKQEAEGDEHEKKQAIKNDKRSHFLLI